MRVVQSSIELATYQHAIAAMLRDDTALVFLDTNVIAWSFRLNDAAYSEFTGWLDRLADRRRLAIPAWVVHEYNHHLLQNAHTFFSPHKSIGSQLQSGLGEFARIARLMINEESAAELGHASRDALLEELSKATDVIQKCASHLTKVGASRQRDRTLRMERIIAACGLASSVHELAESAARDMAWRYANRISPGYKDGDKEENPGGDLIIWREILAACAARKAKGVVFITNDLKADWVYTPRTVVLPNGRPLDGSTEKARTVRLPKPDLLAEFAQHTGSDKLYILSIEAAVDALSSIHFDLNDALNFQHMSHAVRADLERDLTAVVARWFLKNPDAISEAVRGGCYWHYSPEEVDMEAFVAWTVEKMQMKEADAKRVNWSFVFCEFFI